MSGELNWTAAEEHLSMLEAAHAELMGQPGVNPFFGMGVVASLRARLDSGERTADLYDEIMACE